MPMNEAIDHERLQPASPRTGLWLRVLDGMRLKRSLDPRFTVVRRTFTGPKIANPDRYRYRRTLKNWH